jgi:hypothetical protein
MRKKSIIILTIVCIVSLCFFTGLLAYALKLQTERDRQMEKVSEDNSANTEQTDPTVTPSLKETDGKAEVTGIPKSDETTQDNSTAEGTTGTNQDSTAENITTAPLPTDSPTEDEVLRPIVLSFAGDINFNEGSYPMARYDREKKGILGGFSADLVEEMNAADIMMLNNEFSYSTRGAKTPGKDYTFRANPKRIDILKEMGVDIVSLANNHALDYGPDALADTFVTLDNAGIDYIGAGDNLDRAKAPIYYTIGGKKLAYVAASRVVYAMDWYASDNKLGMIGTYDPALILESIKEADANSDYVIIFLHWGVERKSYPESYQKKLAKMYIDAGADIVVGCHPHVLQGFEFYKGKPIAYSLGNYWFNNSSQNTGLFKVTIDTDGSIRPQIIPAKTENTYTSLITEETKRKAYFDQMEKISFGVKIDEFGFITEDN